MIWIIIIIVCTLITYFLWHYQTHDQHPSSIMGRLLGKKWDNENPYKVVNVKDKTFTFHLNLDRDNIVRGVLYYCNDYMFGINNGVESKTDKENNISEKLESLIVMGIEWKSVRIVFKGMNYISYHLEDENHRFQHYMEDRKWEGSFAKKLGIKGLTNIFTM